MVNEPSKRRTLLIAAAACAAVVLLTVGAATLGFWSGDFRLAFRGESASYCDNRPWTPCTVPVSRGVVKVNQPPTALSTIPSTVAAEVTR